MSAKTKEFVEELLKLAEQARHELVPEKRLPVSQARLYSRAVTTDWQTPHIQWEQAWSTQSIQDTLRLLRAAGIYHDNGQLEHAQSCYRRAGEILEWLARSEDELCTNVPIRLLAGGAFQLGGQPAMAAGLLKAVSKNDSYAAFYVAFLSADFDKVVKLSIAFWKKNKRYLYSGRSEKILSNAKSYSVTERFIVIELIRCISLISYSLRIDSMERIQTALKKLLFIDRFLLRTTSVFTWILVHLIRKAAESYVDNSVHLILNALHSSVYPWVHDQFYQFSRRQYAQGRGILWPSQITSIKRLKADESFALCTPTGSGKTLVAVVAVLQNIFRGRDLENGSTSFLTPVVLYLVPSRALAAEVEKKIREQLTGHNILVTGLYGGTDWGLADIWLSFERPTILICTVEKAETIIRYMGNILLSRISQIVIDEAHMVNIDQDERFISTLFAHENRSVRLEQLVERLMTVQPNARRIALTAVAGTAEADLTKWISGRADASPIGSKHRSTRQLIGKLILSRRTEINIDLANGEPLTVGDRGERLFIPLHINAMPTLNANIAQSMYAVTDVGTLWAAMNLAASRRLTVLISVSQKIQTSIDRMLKAIESNAWKKAGLPRFFRAPKKNEAAAALYSDCLSSLADYCGKDSFEFRMMSYGIAVHHGQLPSIPRRLIGDLISRRITPIVIATSTLTEGVNLPFDIILVPSIARSYFKIAKDRGTRVTTLWPVSEFRNLAGRAGRPGATRSVEGMTLVVLPTKDIVRQDKFSGNHADVIRANEDNYKRMMKLLTEESTATKHANSPLASLLDRMIVLLGQLGIRTEKALFAWFESVSVGEIAHEHDGGSFFLCEHPLCQCANGVDYLDGFILNCIEELESTSDLEKDQSQLERRLIEIWRRTLAYLVSEKRDLFERVFIKRANALMVKQYPDADERRQLYRYGFSPYRGRKFAKLVPPLKLALQECRGYSSLSNQQKTDQIIKIANVIAKDDHLGYGLNAKTELVKQLARDWPAVLSWWLKQPSSSVPRPSELRDWLKFVADSFEFRLGAAITAVLSEIWFQESTRNEVPRLETWKEKTGLPWFAFWVKELLRWGTIEPLAAFLLSKGLIVARQDVAKYYANYLSWLSKEKHTSDEPLIDPRLFNRWSLSLELNGEADRRLSLAVVSSLSTEFEREGEFPVLPLRYKNKTRWIDPAGYQLAESESMADSSFDNEHKGDFVLETSQMIVRRTF